MTRAWQNATASRGVLLLLLAAVVMNAITLCAAPMISQRAHPCCPVRTPSTSEHCGKLGCFMSDPVTRPTSFASADPGAAFAVELSSPVSAAVAFAAAPVSVRPAFFTELYVRFRQLLI